MSEWWAEFYPRMYRLLGSDVADPKRTDADADWIWRTAGLGPGPFVPRGRVESNAPTAVSPCDKLPAGQHAAPEAGSRVLDVGCGAGRHAIALALRGAEVVGIDASGFLIENARRLAAEQGVHPRFEVLDMRRVGSLDAAPFHAVILMDSVSGVFDRDETVCLLADLRERIVPGGRLLVSQTHPKWLRGGDKLYTSRLPNGALLQRRFSFDGPSRRLVDQVVVTGPTPGEHEELPAQRLRLYSESEIPALFEQAGYRDVRIWEDLLAQVDGEATEMYVSAVSAVGSP